MPYKAKGKCVYNTDTGEKVGCTKGSVKKYLAALYANVPDAKNESKIKELKKPMKNIKLSEIAIKIINEKDLKTTQEVKVEQSQSNTNGIYEFIKSTFYQVR